MKFRRIVPGTGEASQGAKQMAVLFQSSIEAGEMVYRPMDEEKFGAFFLSPVLGRPEVGKVAILDQEGTAFASGAWVSGEERAYITMVVVDQAARRQGRGRQALSKLEEELVGESGAHRLEMVFYNPMALPWTIPGTHSHGFYHPNAPGVDVDSSGHGFFLACGYQDYAIQNAYFRDLAGYETSQEIQKTQARLAGQGLLAAFYQPAFHHGLKEMVQGFGNPMWEKELLGQSWEAGGMPLLVAVDMRMGGKVCGFAGPLAVEESGRGYFAGIGVDGAYRGRGLAKVLFADLCLGLKEMGAGFMTLFTGKDNPARHIYEAAGFQVVKSWADMRKELDGHGRDAKNEGKESEWINQKS